MKKTEDHSNPDLIVLCRPGYEEALIAELAKRGGSSPPCIRQIGSGWIAVSEVPIALGRALERPLMFERQRMPAPMWVESGQAKGGTIAGLTAPVLAAGSLPWVLHAFTPDPQVPPGITARVEALGQSVVKALLVAHPSLVSTQVRLDAKLGTKGRVVQVCLVADGAWVSVTSSSALSSPAPGGVHAIPGDRLAPSRSYLKLEEAFLVLGRQPAVRERVIDLGAAPGGWSYGCLKRGCQVLAVDNGPMKIRGLDDLPGVLEHRKANGLTFRPPAGWLPTDWLVSDMLVPPGETLGLLRRWLEGGWMRRFVVNLKLPQRHPVEALHPVEIFLSQWPGLRYRITQLYHDRREVTVVGELPAAATQTKSGQGNLRRDEGRKSTGTPTSTPARKPGRKPTHRGKVAKSGTKAKRGKPASRSRTRR